MRVFQKPRGNRWNRQLKRRELLKEFLGFGKEKFLEKEKL